MFKSDLLFKFNKVTVKHYRRMGEGWDKRGAQRRRNCANRCADDRLFNRL